MVLRAAAAVVVGGIRNVDAFDGVYVGGRVGDRIEYRGCVEWGYRAPDVLRIMQAAQDHPLRSSPFTNAPRMKNAV
jgi:hypothetical protein